MANLVDHDWYLKEWLGSLGVSITALEASTGWTHRIANQLVNRKIRWNRDHLSIAATVLKLYPWELLMHPSEAAEIKQLRADASELRGLRQIIAERAEQVAERRGPATDKRAAG